MLAILRKLDMNLLLIFDALYRSGSVTEAANEVALSPSAFSHALNRLRHSLNDPLFIRAGKTMVPTSKAQSLAPVIAASLHNLADCFREQTPFEPASSDRSFTLAATDYTAAVILPALIASINADAPGITLKLIYSQDFNADEDLLSGKVDFAIGFEERPETLRQGIEGITCFTDDYVVAARQGHPEITHSLSRAQYLRAGHVVVKPWMGEQGGIDAYLANQQVRRRIVVELPSLMIAPMIVAGSDLLITLPKRGIATVFNMQALAVFPTPFPTPRYTLKVYHCPALSNSPAHQWMQQKIIAAGAL